MKVILTVETVEKTERETGLLVCELEITSWLADDLARDKKLEHLSILIPSIHNRYSLGFAPNFRTYRAMHRR